MEPFKGNAATAWGTTAEPQALSAYEAVTGQHITNCMFQGRWGLGAWVGAWDGRGMFGVHGCMLRHVSLQCSLLLSLQVSCTQLSLPCPCPGLPLPCSEARRPRAWLAGRLS